MTNQMDVRHAQAVRELSRRSFVGGALSAGTVLALGGPGPFLRRRRRRLGCVFRAGHLRVARPDRSPLHLGLGGPSPATEGLRLAALEQAKGYADQFAAYQGTATRSADDLLAFLQLDDSATRGPHQARKCTRTCKRDEDTGDSTYLDYASQTDAVVRRRRRRRGVVFFRGARPRSPGARGLLPSPAPNSRLYRRRLDLIAARPRPYARLDRRGLARRGGELDGPARGGLHGRERRRPRIRRRR